ncbi:MAG: CidA/LrgA family protein [Treponema sp.]|nr:CidA/LrgA family protein [Treponema sp.]
MKILMQCALLCTICLAGNAVAAVLPFTFPGSICALLILLALFYTKLLTVEQFAPTGNWLLHNMAFFFLPANIRIMEEFELISQVWLPVVCISVVSVVVAFAAAAGAATLSLAVQKKIIGSARRSSEEESHG